MRKNGLALVELLILVAMISVVAGICVWIGSFSMDSAAIRTDITAGILPADPDPGKGLTSKRAVFFYEVCNRYGCKRVKFEDIGPFDAKLDSVRCERKQLGDMFVLDQNSAFPEGESWENWVERFDQVRAEYATGLKPGAEEFLQARKRWEGKK